MIIKKCINIGTNIKNNINNNLFIIIINMAHITYSLEALEGLMKRNPESNHYKGLYKKKKEYLDSLKKSSKPKLRPLTKQELEDIKYWEKAVKENDKEWNIYKETKKKDGKKVPPKKQTAVDNDFRNNDINWRRRITIIKAQPEIELYSKDIQDKFKKGEITEEEMENLIFDTKNSLSNELQIKKMTKEYREKTDASFDRIAYLNSLISFLAFIYNYFLTDRVIGEKIKKFNNDYGDNISIMMKNLQYDEVEKLLYGIYKDIGKENVEKVNNNYKRFETHYFDRIFNEPISEPKKRGRPPKINKEEAEKIKKTSAKINRRTERAITNEPIFEKEFKDIEEKHKKISSDMDLLKHINRHENIEKYSKELSKDKAKEKELKGTYNKLAFDKDIGTIMKGKSDLTKSKSGKYSVETEFNVKNLLNKKIKKALKQSILTEVDKKFKGLGVRNIDLDYSSDDMYGMGYESDSSSDEEDTEEYSKILKHLVGHITDKKEKLDKMDAKQAKEIINKLIKKRGRPKK